jgi:hypothetical protein
MAHPKLCCLSMKAPTKARLAQSGVGRMILHLLALRRDRHLAWHVAGMMREVRRMVRLIQF